MRCIYNVVNHNMSMTEFYISTYIDWVNHNACFTFLLMGTFS